MMTPSQWLFGLTAILGGTGMLLVFFTSWRATGSALLVLGMLCTALHDTILKAFSTRRGEAS